MARIRNLIYNGITVEQPIYNGIELTQWVHNGIVVWEKGSTVITPIQATAVSNALKYWWNDGNNSGLSYHNGRVYYYGYEHPSPRVYTIKCYSVPYSDLTVEPTLEWSITSDSAYNSAMYAQICNVVDSSYYVTIPWDTSKRAIQLIYGVINVDGDYYVGATFNSGSYVDFRTYSKLNLSQSYTFTDDPDSRYNVFISASEMISLNDESVYTMNGYTVYTNGVKTAEYIFNDDTFKPKAFFNNCIIGVNSYRYMKDGVIQTGYKLSKVQYGSNIVETITDLTDAGYNYDDDVDLYETWKRSVDILNKDYIALPIIASSSSSNTPYALIIDRSFNCYITPSSTYSPTFGYILVGKYLVELNDFTVYELTFPSP